MWTASTARCQEVHGSLCGNHSINSEGASLSTQSCPKARTVLKNSSCPLSFNSQLVVSNYSERQGNFCRLEAMRPCPQHDLMKELYATTLFLLSGI
ncbi:hypothetical protein RRG08_019780 [Elysia crispata]|uniref:Uncharacterized protein n=1 Tax=Elysia crispata TaxID=231223 RepID=A0AAE1E666_9GAST|nr:hypothetical protein RRG08_019780 [Elysia crispata]